MQTYTLEQIIRQHVNLDPRPNGRGFFPVLCRVCNDHGRKGKRAGFKFDETGTVGYNCFNCDHSARYDPSTDEVLSRDMITVLTSFGIPEVDWAPVLFNALAAKEGGQIHASKMIVNATDPEPLTLPPFFYPLTDDGSDLAATAIAELTRRKVDWKSHPFFLVREDSKYPDNKQWLDRLIIPVYKGKDLVFWQGRDLFGRHTRKYLSPSVDKGAIISNYEVLTTHTNDPIYVVEGWFDAYHIQGTAVFGKVLTDAQITLLNRSRRPKVVIPDRKGDGDKLAKQALKLGWGISTPEIGSCKDVNDAVMKYGLLYTRTSIVENTTTDPFVGAVQLGAYCEIEGRSSQKQTDKPHRKAW